MRYVRLDIPIKSNGRPSTGLTFYFRNFQERMIMNYLLNRMLLLGVALTFLVGPTAWAKQPTRQMLEKVDKALPSTAHRSKKPHHILIYSGSKGYRHGSIELGVEAIRRMGKKTGAYTSDEAKDVSVFTDKNLKKYDAIVFVSSTGEIFKKAAHRKALMKFVKGGKGIVGIHAATDANYKWLEYGQMMGGYFNGHPWRSNTPVYVNIEDKKHKLCECFHGKGLSFKEEIYQFKNYSRKGKRVLLGINLAKSTKVRGLKRKDNDYPVAWIKRHGRGRVFYCSLGHNHFMFWHPQVLKFYLNGIQYVLKDIDGAETSLPLNGIKPSTMPTIMPSTQPRMRLHTKAARIKLRLKKSEVNAPFDMASLSAKLKNAREKRERQIRIQAVRDARLKAKMQESRIWEEMIGFGKAGRDEKVRNFRALAGRVAGAGPEVKADFAKKVWEAMGKATPEGAKVLCRVGLGASASAKDREALVGLMKKNTGLSMVAAKVLALFKDKKTTLAFREALTYTKGGLLVDVIRVLGQRKDAGAYGQLVGFVRDRDAAVRGSAIEAIGRLGGADSVGLMMVALGDAVGQSLDEQKAYARGGLSLADRMAKGDEMQQMVAGDLYRKVLGLKLVSGDRRRGILGYCKFGGNAAADMVMGYLKSGDSAVQLAAIEGLSGLDDVESFKALSMMLSRFNTSNKVAAIDALAKRSKGEKLGRNEAQAGKNIAVQLGHYHKKVRAAAMRALSILGAPSTMAQIAKVGVMRGEQQQAAEAIGAFRGKWYRQTLIDAIGDAELSGRVRGVMIAASEKRGLPYDAIKAALQLASRSGAKTLKKIADKVIAKYEPKSKSKLKPKPKMKNKEGHKVKAKR